MLVEKIIIGGVIKRDLDEVRVAVSVGETCARAFADRARICMKEFETFVNIRSEFVVVVVAGLLFLSFPASRNTNKV